MRRRVGRASAVLAATVLLVCTGALGPGLAATQPDRPRPPGVPPPIDLGALRRPQAAAANIPFDNSVPGLRQVRGPEPGRSRGCVAAGDFPELTVEPSPWGQRRLRFAELRKFATGAGQVIAVIDTG